MFLVKVIKSLKVEFGLIFSGAAFVLTVLTGCGQQEENPILGSWRELDNPKAQVGEIVFLPSGAFRYERFYGATAVNMLSQMNGRYTVTNVSKLTMTVEGNSAGVTDESAILDDKAKAFASGEVITAHFSVSDDGDKLYIDASPRLNMHYQRVIE